MKPGIKTTEFWLSLIGNVLAFAVALGVVSSADKATLEGALTTIVTSAIALVGAVTIVVTYVRGRIAAKSQAEAAPMPMMATGDMAMAGVIPQDVEQEARAAGMPIFMVLMLLIRYRDDIAKVLEFIRQWRR
jgi:hypothetical protein